MTPEIQAQIIQRQASQIGEMSFQNTVLSAQLDLVEKELADLKAAPVEPKAE